MDVEILEGYYEDRKEYPIYKHTYKQGNLSARNEYACCSSKGKGIQRNRIRGMKHKRILN
jgi:hypothetical protein